MLLTAIAAGALDELGVLVKALLTGPITGVDQGNKVFTTSANLGGLTGSIVVTGSTGNDGVYTIVSAVYDTDHTDITVSEAIPDSTADGDLTATAAAGSDDDVDAAGFALTQGAVAGVKSLTDLVTGGGSLTLTGSFSCPDVQEVPIIVPNGVISTISFGTSGVDPGCQYSGSGNAIECQAGGTVTDVTGHLTNSGAGTGAYNYGTWIDFSGTLTEMGNNGTAVHNCGTWTDFSGSLTLGGNGTGAYNDFDAIWIDFSGTLTHTGRGTAVMNDGGTWTDFSGSLNNSGTGFGAMNNYGTWHDFSGSLTNSGDEYGAVNQGGSWIDFSGDIYLGAIGWYPDCSMFDNGMTGTVQIAPQADLAAGNILTGKTILAVAGSEIGSAAQLATDQAAVLAEASNIKTGTTILGQAGSYPTSATSKAEQLATDQASVLASADKIATGTTILGQAGSYPTSATSKAEQLVTDQAAVLSSADKIATGTTILGQAGSYPTTETSKAEQLATDQATININVSKIKVGEVVLAGSNPGTLNASGFGLLSKDVRQGTVVGDVLGALNLPSESDVRKGVVYDSGS